MINLDYADAVVPVREDLVSAHRAAWNSIASPGRWWDGSQRVLIAREVTEAKKCAFCAARKEALSFRSVQGNHETSSNLPEGAVEAIHRIVTDPARLTENWLRDNVLASISEDQYVELLGVVAKAVTLGGFAHAVGASVPPVLDPAPEQPSKIRPAGAKRNLAWVSTVAPEDASETEKAMYPGGWKAPNIRRAMSLVPEEVVGFFDLCDEHYIPTKWIWDFDKQVRSITNAQIELVAARVSLLNGCFY